MPISSFQPSPVLMLEGPLIQEVSRQGSCGPAVMAESRGVHQAQLNRCSYGQSPGEGTLNSW